MKKTSSILIAIVLISAALTLSALAGMTSLEDGEMSTIKGQVGIRLDVRIKASNGYLSLMDYDGLQDGSKTYADRGCIIFGSFWANDGTTSKNPIVGENWTIEAGSTATKSYVCLGLGTLVDTDNNSATEPGFGFDSFKLGKEPDPGNSLNTHPSIGSIALTDIQMAGSKIYISPK